MAYLTVEQRAALLVERAQELVDEDGKHWVKGTLKRAISGRYGSRNAEYAYCMVGALQEAHDQARLKSRSERIRRDLYEAFRVANEQVLQSINTPARPTRGWRSFYSIPMFNDAADTTYEDVKRVFKHAFTALSNRAKRR